MMRSLSVLSSAVVVVVGLVGGACATLVNPVAFTSEPGAPTLEPRPDGCSVDISDENGPPPRPHRVIGRLELSWSPDRIKEQGAEGALKTLRTAACEHGGHLVLNMRALPRGFNEGVLYEADLAVLLDEKGEMLIGAATATSSSSGDVTSTSVMPAAPTTP